MIKFNSCLLLALLCITQSIYANDLAKASPLFIENAWIAEAPPNSKVMVAYMTFKNPSTKNIKIILAESPIYSSIEFHESKHQDGFASMTRHQHITINAKASVYFRPGGKHMMLFNPKRQLKTGDTAAITFTTIDNDSFTISVTVKKQKF